MDSGNISDSASKLDVILSSMSQLKYDAVGLGNAEVQMGGVFYQKAAANKLTVLDASPAADKRTVPYIIKNVGGVRVGIVSFGMLAPDAKVNEYELRKLRFVAYKDVRSKCDVLVLLDQAGVSTDAWLQRNAARLGAPDIVVPGNSRNSANPVYAEQVFGVTHVMPTFFQAKEMGVVDVEFTPGQPLNITSKRVSLDDKFVEDQQIADAVGKAILAMGVAPQPLPLPVSPEIQSIDRTSVKPYYSPLLCKACHQKQYEDWAQTKHAKALKTLADKKNMTPDCLPCHSELYRATRNSMALNKLDAGVECATCHMNTLPHGLERKNMAVHSTVDPKLCLECHTKQRSPTYNVKTYFPQVTHSGKAPTTTAANPRPAK